MSRKLKTVVIDDERLARTELKRLLSGFSEIEVVGEAAGIHMALQEIEKHKPDVLFLDIQLRNESGFDLLEKIQSNIKVIFVTAFDKYAIRAFEVNALDYLLKPVETSRLKEAIYRLQISQNLKDSSDRILAYDDRLFVNIGNRSRFLKISTIEYISARGKYTEIFTFDGHRGLVLKPIGEWERRLPSTNFVRIHRSTIINFDHVKEVEKWFNYTYQVFLKNIPEPFIMSRRYASRLKERMG